MRRFSLKQLTTGQWIGIILGIIYLIWKFILMLLPYMFGAQFDKAVLNSIDTEGISENYVNFDYRYSSYDDAYELRFYEDNIMPSSSKGSIYILILIHDSDRYSHNVKVKKSFSKLGNGSYENITFIKKDNVQISILESNTPKLRSRYSEQALIEVLKKMQALKE